MAQTPHLSLKKIKIDKANTTIMVVVSVAAFIVIFSLVASKALVSQYGYLSRVIHAKQVAENQLKSDVASLSNLNNSYEAFISLPQNLIGGNPSGTGQNDGNNSKIILDALPSKYDFPGLVTSFYNLLNNQGFTVNSISGIDQQLVEQNNQSSTSPIPQQIPISISAAGSYSAMQNMFSLLQRSIRPIIVQSISFNGSASSLTTGVTGYTYYQPEKTFSINYETIK